MDECQEELKVDESNASLAGIMMGEKVKVREGWL